MHLTMELLKINASTLVTPIKSHEETLCAFFISAVGIVGHMRASCEAFKSQHSTWLLRSFLIKLRFHVWAFYFTVAYWFELFAIVHTLHREYVYNTYIYSREFVDVHVSNYVLCPFEVEVFGSTANCHLALFHCYVGGFFTNSLSLFSLYLSFVDSFSCEYLFCFTILSLFAVYVYIYIYIYICVLS